MTTVNLEQATADLAGSPQVTPMPLTDTTVDDGGRLTGVATEGGSVVEAGMVEFFAGKLRLLGDGLSVFTEWDGWKLTEPEIQNIARAMERCRMRYFPTFGNSESSEVFDLILAVAGSFGIRFYMYKKEMKQKLEAKEAAKNKTE